MTRFHLRSNVSCFYQLHGPSQYHIPNVIICIANDDWSNIDMIDVKSERVCVILNLITYIVENINDDCFVPLYGILVSK
jgi:hypothetical protein